MLIALLDVVLPYNIAFKLVTVLGPLALPAGTYVFARGIHAPRPATPMLALAATGFLFFKGGGDATMTFDFHIMGGNLPSTLAGEFSFMIALALSLFFLGTLARSTRRGPLWLPAVFLALTIMSHVVVAIFAVYTGVVIWLIIRPVKNFTRLAAIGVVGALLTAFWFLPLAVNLGNTTDMRYEPIGNYLDWMFLSENWFLYPLAVVALGAGIWFRRRATLIVAAITVATGLVFWNWEGLREIFGKAPAWNLRLLPFWILMLYLLAGLGIAELVRLLAVGITWVVRGDRPFAPAYVPLTPPEVARAEGTTLVDDASPPRRCRHRHRHRRGVRLPRPAPRRPPRRDGRGRRHRHDHLPRDRAERARLHPVLGSLQLHRLRERHDGRLHRQVVARVPRLPRHREPLAPGPHVVGRRRRDRRVRHAAGADIPMKVSVSTSVRMPPISTVLPCQCGAWTSKS